MAKMSALFFCTFSLAITLQGQDQRQIPLDSHEIMIDIGDNNTFNVFINTSMPTSKNDGSNNAYNEDFLVTRKPGKKQFILAGLAQACSDLGQIVGAANSQEKQQGYLNLLSTVLQVSAGLQNQTPQTTQNHPQQPATQAPVTAIPTKGISIADDNEDVAQLLLNLTEKLTACMTPEQGYPTESTRALMPLIREVIQHTAAHDKLVCIKKLLGNKQLTAQFLQELFSSFYSILCSYIPSMTTDTQMQSTTQTINTPSIENKLQTPLKKANNDSNKSAIATAK